MINCLKSFFTKKPAPVSKKHPADFLVPYYAELRKRGLKMIEHPMEIQFTTGPICGAQSPGQFIACEIPHTPICQFDITYWSTLSETLMRCLAYHEFSHKVLQAPHAKPPHLMQPALLTEAYFVANEEKLLDDVVEEYKKRIGV